MRYAVLVLFLTGTIPSSAFSQSLAEAARQARERREQRARDAADDEVPSYGNEDLADDDEAEAEDEDEADGEDDSEAKADRDADAREERVETALEEVRRTLAREASDRRASQRRQAEATWRRAAQQARARIDAAKRELAAFDELWLVQGERYVDDEGRTVIRDLDHLRALKARAQQEVEAAERALEELRTRARREGVPPGWLR